MDGWLNLVLERMAHENTCTTPTRASVGMEGPMPRYDLFLSDSFMSNFVVIYDIFDLFGDIVSKKRVRKRDFLSTQMNIIFRNLRL